MRLYLRSDLIKSCDDLTKAKKRSGIHNTMKTGETRGGSYVARAQIGIEKDGSPLYRYFRSEDEYQTYLDNKGKTKAARDLEDKVKREHETSKEKTAGSKSDESDDADDKSDSDKKKAVSKSLKLYVEG